MLSTETKFLILAVYSYDDGSDPVAIFDSEHDAHELIPAWEEYDKTYPDLDTDRSFDEAYQDEWIQEKDEWAAKHPSGVALYGKPASYEVHALAYVKRS